MRLVFSGFFVVFAILQFVGLRSFGQDISSAELKLMRVLDVENSSIPKDLQVSKTVVIISIGNRDDSGVGDWKTFAEESHFYIKKLRIDAVLYFYIDEAIAGYDVQRAISSQLINRDIKNMVLLSKDIIDGRDQFIGVVTPFNKEPTYISNNQPAWKSQTSDLEILFRNLARAIDRANLKSENLLIIDSPEYYRGSDIINGKRFELLNTDLRIDKLAVPKFVDLAVPEVVTTTSSSQILKAIQDNNAENLVKNAKLEQVFSKYPYQYEIVPYEYDEKKLLAKGFQFVLMQVNSSQSNVRSLLAYRSNVAAGGKKLNDNASSANNLVHSADEVTIYKYYVKHINSGDIYLGEIWDAANNWLDALNNHVTTIINQLGKK